MDGDEDEIPSDIASEFQRMSDDADAILQSIRNDEAQQKQKQQQQNHHGRQQQPAQASAAGGPKRRTSGSGVRPPTGGGQLFGDAYYDDDDMTDELHHLDSVPIDLQRELSALDSDRVSELLLHGDDDDDLNDGDDLEDNDEDGGTAPTGRGCGASATAPPKNFQFRSTPTTPLIQNHPASSRGQSSAPENRVSFPHDPAVAELRALTKDADEDAGREGAPATKRLPSGGRVLKPIPPGPLESVPWILVVAFAVVWAVAAVLLRHSASSGFLDDQGTIRLPTIWR